MNAPEQTPYQRLVALKPGDTILFKPHSLGELLEAKIEKIYISGIGDLHFYIGPDKMVVPHSAVLFEVASLRARPSPHRSL